MVLWGRKFIDMIQASVVDAPVAVMPKGRESTVLTEKINLSYMKHMRPLPGLVSEDFSSILVASWS